MHACFGKTEFFEQGSGFGAELVAALLQKPIIQFRKTFDQTVIVLLDALAQGA